MGFYCIRIRVLESLIGIGALLRKTHLKGALIQKGGAYWKEGTKCTK